MMDGEKIGSSPSLRVKKNMRRLVELEEFSLLWRSLPDGRFSSRRMSWSELRSCWSFGSFGDLSAGGSVGTAGTSLK